MPCAVNASWEADVIILSGFVLMIPVVQRSQK
jgi:hypothetical protein